MSKEKTWPRRSSGPALTRRSWGFHTCRPGTDRSPSLCTSWP